MGALARRLLVTCVLLMGALAAACSAPIERDEPAAADLPARQQAAAHDGAAAVPASISAVLPTAVAEIPDSPPLDASAPSNAPPEATPATGAAIGDDAGLQSTLDADSPVLAPRLFGPDDGAIAHNPSNPGSMRLLTGADVADLVISAEFTNPFDPDRRPYDHGILLRVNGRDFHAVIVGGDGRWRHFVSRGRSMTLKTSGEAIAFVRDRGEANSMAIVAAGDEATLFINGVVSANLDLSDLRMPGDAGLVANLVSETQVLGAQTPFTALTVGGIVRIEIPAQGILVHDRSGVAVGEPLQPAGPMLVQAEFSVPYAAREGDWSYGFLLTGSDGSTNEISFNDRSLWQIHSRPSEEVAGGDVSFGQAAGATFEPGEQNRLMLIYLQGEWRLYLNEAFVTTVDLPDGALPVSVTLVGGVNRGEQPPESESSYAGFTAWALGN